MEEYENGVVPNTGRLGDRLPGIRSVIPDAPEGTTPQGRSRIGG